MMYDCNRKKLLFAVYRFAVIFYGKPLPCNSSVYSNKAGGKPPPHIADD